ncbi:dTDP-4-dehydrorhamnose reductase [Filimonas lacunae]|uniref:dTDP-4-dehydrorhamnose reductase n=1 Tax=Filimonas lacunae TaxID=477680 RepID=A0A173ML01_9BACT|nr:SDR family oxidoreductase [Filimonas lacunae]BAV08078.1 dTDP-4-dehydrorhamnose reductase [Filimonas lacunae]SIT08968.1 dTDP-4-dehydrorhamnose reductase [Filimonas lacunae]
MKVLVTGANGFLGQHLCLHLDKAGFSVAATGRGDSRLPFAFSQIYYPADLTSREEVADLVSQVQPDVIVHAAAMSKPDECNNQRETCLLHNVEVTRYLIDAANNTHRQVHFVYISTDFVLGDNGPHDETVAPAPLNFYGESKLQSEQLVAAHMPLYTIMRPVFIYGPVWEGLKGGFLQWVQQSLEQGKPIKVVNDQLRTPTFIGDICKGLEAIIHKQNNGIYHLAGKEVLSPYQMAIQLAERLALDASLITSVTADTFNEPVKRAKKAGLQIGKAETELGYVPVSFNEGLQATFGKR